MARANHEFRKNESDLFGAKGLEAAVPIEAARKIDRSAHFISSHSTDQTGSDDLLTRN
jgi:hypothetical protein